MAVSVTDIADRSDADILKALKASLFDAAIAQALSINGRQLSRIPAEATAKLIELYEAKVSAATNDGGMSAIVQFGEPQ